MLFDENPVYWMIGVSSIVALVYLGLFLHEWGHWLMARLGGYRILGMSIGSGKRLRQYHTRRGIVDFRLAPVEGFVLAVKDDVRESKVQALLLSAGGPLLTALFIAALVVVRQQLPLPFLSDPHNKVLGQILGIALVLEGISLAYNVWPRATSLGANDGLSIVNILRSAFPKENYYQESLRDIRSAIESTPSHSPEPIPENPIAREAMLHFLQCYHFNDWRSSTARLDQTLRNETLGPEEHELLLSSLAEIALISRDEEALGTATDHAEGFLELHPEREFLKSRLGALQIEQGNYLNGKLLLRPLAQSSTLASIRAFAFSYLALGAFRQFGREEAIDLLSEARSFDPGCSALYRIRHEIFGGSRSSLTQVRL